MLILHNDFKQCCANVSDNDMIDNIANMLPDEYAYLIDRLTHQQGASLRIGSLVLSITSHVRERSQHMPLQSQTLSLQHSLTQSNQIKASASGATTLVMELMNVDKQELLSNAETMAHQSELAKVQSNSSNSS